MALARSCGSFGLASGAGQSVSATAQFVPVTMAVTDDAGHPVIAAPVTVYQSVSAWEGPCASARCAAAPTLTHTVTQMVSDATGELAVTPLQVVGTAGETAVTAVSGVNGYATLTLISTP